LAKLASDKVASFVDIDKIMVLNEHLKYMKNYNLNLYNTPNWLESLKLMEFDENFLLFADLSYIENLYFPFLMTFYLSLMINLYYFQYL